MAGIIAFMILIAVVFAFFSSPKGRGVLGEWRVRAVVGKTHQGVRYVINDYTFSLDGRTAQIDHIVITRYGVYVIETKNYSGRIYGDDSQRYWTQVLAGGKVKNRFYSPVKQNSTHVAKLNQLLEEDGVYLTSVVVFVKNNVENVRSDTVVPLSALRARLSVPQKKKAYTESEMRHIYDTLMYYKGDVSAKEHLSNITELKKLVECGFCPRCKSPLVKRNGKYGEFYGCSAYPQCNFIRK